jgi:alpha-amylase
MFWRRLLASVWIVLGVGIPALSLATSGPVAAQGGPDATDPWWQDAVFYEVFVRSYLDTNGDGSGDLRGLIELIDYLNDGSTTTNRDLGVTALWLMPVAEAASPHGYDVLDYTTIESDYGTNADFRAFVDAAHARGMRVIVDLVLNHTSDAHPWFVAAASDPASPYRDWYLWADAVPDGADSSHWHASGDSFYYGYFGSDLPDLNYRNPAVTAAMIDVARFWLADMDVDGFRLDAAQYLIEDGNQLAGTPETQAWLADFRRAVEDIKPGALVLGEVRAPSAEIEPYITGGALDLAFEFDLAGAILDSIRAEDASALAAQIQAILAAYPDGGYATFLTNHDQARVRSQVGADPARLRLAATALLSLPGVPFLYYGEEIGMSGTKPDPLLRTPMQWTDGAQAGFTTGQPWIRINADYRAVNVVDQLPNSASLLARYRHLIGLRMRFPALQTGDLVPLESACPEVYAFLRHTEAQTLLVALNFGADDARDCTLSLEVGSLPAGRYAVRDILNGPTLAPLTVDTAGGFRAYLPVDPLPAQYGLIAVLDARPEAAKQ